MVECYFEKKSIGTVAMVTSGAKGLLAQILRYELFLPSVCPSKRPSLIHQEGCLLWSPHSMGKIIISRITEESKWSTKVKKENKIVRKRSR